MLLPVPRHLDGTVAPLDCNRNKRSAPALLIVLRDRTEIEQLAQMRADFVANASHELRTPLASLKGFVETLQGAAKDDAKAREQFLAIMQEQAERMSRLIDDLLSLSRIEMRQHVMPTGAVDLGPLVTGTLLTMRPIAEKAAIEIHFAQPSEPISVRGDRDELAQVVQNLIQNAVKYGKAGGRVHVTLANDERRVVLTVSDDGVGIAPHHIPRLTERFYRVNAKESRERGGTGLGLAIVKHIVNRHRGELMIESELGKGSKFTVLLPVARSEQNVEKSIF
ncbi:MAG: ATP-binding protein [Hyphomicrobiaceae bacterium]